MKSANLNLNLILKKFFFVSICLLINNALFAEILTWEDCVKYTKANNPTLKISQEKINQAETNISISKKNLSPNMDFSMSSSRNTNDNTNNSYSLAFKQTIFDNKKNFYSVQALEKTLLAAKSDFVNISSQIRYQLRLAFINLFYAQEALKVSESIMEIRKNNYELVQMNFSSGLENKGSLLLSEAQFLEAETAVKDAKSEIIKMQKNLANVMGNVNYSSFTVACSFDLKENPNDNPDFQVIAASNPAITSLKAQKESEEFNLKLQSIKISPSLALSASAGQSNNNLLTNNDLTHSYGLNLSIPIFAGNLRQDKIKNAQSAYNQALLNIENNKNDILNSLTEKWLNFQSSINDVQTKNKFLEAYDKRSEITKAKYSIGLVTFDNWTIIEDNLINAKKSYLQTQIDTLKKEAEWIEIKGGTLDYE